MGQTTEFQFRSPFEGDAQQVLASPLDRLAAVVVDALILLPVVQLAQSPIKKELLTSLAFEESSSVLTWRLLSLFVLFFVFWIYNTVSIYLFSQTLGKKIFGLKVVSLHSKRSLYSCSLRSLSFFVECFLLGLPFISLFTHPWRRAYHDRLGDTLVLSSKRRVGSPSLGEKRRAYAFSAALLLFATLSSSFYALISTNSELVEWASKIEEKKCQTFLEKEPVPVAEALKQHAIKKIGADCLKKVAKASLWKNEDRALANLANSFAYSEEEELSYNYLTQVCKEEGEGRACLFSRWVSSNPIDNDPSMETIQEILSGGVAEDFYKIYFISALQSHNQHREAQVIIDQVEDGDEISGFLSLATFRALLWQKKWESAYWVYKTSHISESAFMEFIEESRVNERLSRRQLMTVIEQFYPHLKASKRRYPASSPSSTPVEIRGLWMRLKEEGL